MKKALLYLTIFCILCGFIESGVNYSIGKQIENQSPLYLSFASIGANLLESRLDCWAKIKTASTSQELNEYLIHVLTHLELPIEPHKFIYNQDNGIHTLQYQCVKNNETCNFTLQLNPKNENYFILSIVAPNDSHDLKRYQNKLQEIMNCKYYYLYSGCINNLYDYNSQEQLLKTVMKKLDAKITDIYKNNKIISMTGYSKKLETYVPPVYASQAKYNVQVAIRSNIRERKTYIYIGSPLILGEY